MHNFFRPENLEPPTGSPKNRRIMKVLNQDQIRWVDEQTLLYQNLSPMELMFSAVHQLYKHVRHLPIFDPLKPVYIFAGSGNNGGDGIGLARLMGEEGMAVSLYHCDSKTPTAENQSMREQIPHRKHVSIHHIRTPEDFPTPEPTAIIIDAIFGHGINRPADGVWLELIHHINALPNKVISIDIPSGLNPDRVMENAAMIQADYTLTVGHPKLTFFFPELENVIGKWKIVDIQHSVQAIDMCETDYYYIDRNLILSEIQVQRRRFSHKGTFGHALLINGSYGKMGAAILAARACLRSGAGLLTCHVPRTGYVIMQTSVPEAMVSVDEDDHYFTTRIEPEGYEAIGIGSGLDNNKSVMKALFHIIENSKVPLILDADALNIIAEHPDRLKILPEDSILTPHPGEFKRLFGSWDDDLEKLERQRKFSVDHKIYIVLKGANTSLSCPDGKIYFNSTGNPGMATAGSGDTLTGIITALAAQGLGSKHAAILGIYIHGLAGDLSVQDSSQISLISSDITEHLGQAFFETFGL